MTSDTSSHPPQVVCKVLSWIYLSRTRKDLQGKQKLVLNVYMELRQEALNVTREGQDLHLL